MKTRFRSLYRSGNWQLSEITNVDHHTYLDMRAWCNKTFPARSWEARRKPNNTETTQFVFKRQQDATMYMLKWKT